MASSDTVAGELQRRLGRNVRAWRKAHGLSQEALAEHVGTSRPYVSAIERGQRSVGLGMVQRLAEGMGVSVSDLLAE